MEDENQTPLNQATAIKAQPDDGSNAQAITPTPSLPEHSFVNRALNYAIGDHPSEGVQPIGSPVDLVAGALAAPLAEGVGMVAQAAPRLLGNEVGAIGSNIAPLIEQNMGSNLKNAAMNTLVRGPEGGITNGVAQQQSGTIFQAAANERARAFMEAAAKDRLARRGYADGGEVAPTATPPAQVAPQIATPTATPQPQGINVFNPDGELVSIPANQLNSALSSGYSEASDDDIHEHVQQQKYGSTGQQIMAHAEALGRGVAGPLATAAQVALGGNRENILGREEANPSTALSEGVGLGASLLTGFGEAALAEKGAVAGAKVLGLGAESAAHIAAQKAAVEAAELGLKGKALKSFVSAAKEEALTPFSTAAKIGSAAVKGAIENSVIQSGNEVSKMILQDPKQSAETAIMDVGLAGLIGSGVGGTIGSVSPLWKATFGKPTDEALQTISNRLGGIEGVENNSIDKAFQAAGLSPDQVSPEIRAAYSQNPSLQHSAQMLMESSTGSGQEFQKAMHEFKGSLSDQASMALGKSPEEMEHLQNLNDYEIGDKIRSTIKDRISEDYEPLAKSYQKISEKFKGVDIAPGIKDQLGEDIAKTLGDGVSPESAQAKLVDRVLREVPHLKNLEQLRNYTSGLSEETSGIAKQELWDIGRKLRGALNNAEENALNHTVEREAPELLAEHLETNAKYKELKNLIGDVNDRIKAGNPGGPKTFLKNLDEMDPETILSRLNPTRKADIIDELTKNFPSVANDVRDYHLAKIVNQASRKGEGGAINVKELNKLINGDKVSPQMRNFLASPESQAKIKALNALLDNLPEKINKSGTAKAVDGLLSHLPGTATGLGMLLGGHNALASGLVGAFTKVIGRDAPDAVRLSLLKFLGSNKEINAPAFKASVDYLHSIVKGEAALNKAITNTFKIGSQVLPPAMFPDHKDIKRLDSKLDALRTSPDALLKVGGDATHYNEEHGQHIGQMAASAVAYLNSIKPQTSNTTPLGPKGIIDPIAKAKYERALTIAEQPLVVLNHLQKGTLQPSDVVALKSMYPSLYGSILNKAVNQMTEELTKGHNIPYATRMGLSVFMSQPLDGTMTPNGIMSAQMTQNPPQQGPGAPQGGTLRPSQKGASGLAKIPNAYQTPGQAREAQRVKP